MIENTYHVTLNYWATVEVTARNRAEAIKKAHDIDCAGHLEGGEEEVALISGSEPAGEGLCPCCKGQLTLHPALSRRGDYYVCPECGTREALEDFEASRKRQSEAP